MAKQTKSQRIRVLIAQGKTVKEIAKAVKCNPGLVYQVKAYDKRKEAKAKKPAKKAVEMKTRGYEPAQVWLKSGVSTSLTLLRVHDTTQPKDYYQPKRNVVQRFFNWLCGG